MTWQLEHGTARLANLSHVGIAVKERRSNSKASLIDLEHRHSRGLRLRAEAEEMIAGRPFKVRLVFIKFGPLTLELLEPLDDESIWSKFIAERARASITSPLGVSNYDEMVEKFRRRAIRCSPPPSSTAAAGATSTLRPAEPSSNFARNTRGRRSARWTTLLHLLPERAGTI